MSRKLTGIALAAALAVAGGAAFAQEQLAAAPIAGEHIGGTMLTVSPMIAYERAVLRISGPGEYELTERFTQGAIGVDLLAGVGRELAPQSTLGKRPAADAADRVPILPDGRYIYELSLYLPDGEVRAHRGVFFVEGGATVSRVAKRAALTQIREELVRDEASTRPSVGDPEPSGVESNYVYISDTANDGSVYAEWQSDLGTDWTIYNDGGDFEIREETNSLNPGTVRMFFTENTSTSEPGNVGIGTTAPQDQLHLVQTGIDFLRFSNSHTFRFNMGSTGLWFYDNDGNQIAKFNHSAETNNLVVANQGVGIGTTPTTGTELHIMDELPVVQMETPDLNHRWQMYVNTFTSEFRIRDRSNFSSIVRIRKGAPSTSLFIKEDGNVGLGTDDPQAALELAPSSGNAAFRLNFSGGENWAVSNTGSIVTFNLIGSGGQEATFRRRNDGQGGLATFEVQGTARATQHTNSSSRELKTDFAELDGRMVLAKLSEMPVSSWRYKTEGESTRHFGPVAEDFQQVFGLGNGKTISTVDAQGVSMAAIQGLHDLVREKEGELASLRGDNEALRAEVEELRSLIESVLAAQQ
jgi:hypothetical protein